MRCPENSVYLSVLAVTMLIERRKRAEGIITIWALNVTCIFEVLVQGRLRIEFGITDIAFVGHVAKYPSYLLNFFLRKI